MDSIHILITHHIVPKVDWITDFILISSDIASEKRSLSSNQQHSLRPIT